MWLDLRSVSCAPNKHPKLMQLQETYGSILDLCYMLLNTCKSRKSDATDINTSMWLSLGANQYLARFAICVTYLTHHLAATWIYLYRMTLHWHIPTGHVCGLIVDLRRIQHDFWLNLALSNLNLCKIHVNPRYVAGSSICSAFIKSCSIRQW